MSEHPDSRYVAAEAFTKSVSLDSGIADPDVEVALDAASRAIDEATGRRFWLDSEPTARLFTARSGVLVPLDDVTEISEVAVRRNGTFEPLDTDAWVAEPLNAPADGKPYLWIKATRGTMLPAEAGAVRVTGKFGWPDIPSQVKQLTTILASKLLKRSREAPFGVISVGGIDGIAARIAREDPDLHMLIGPLKRNQPVVY